MRWFARYLFVLAVGLLVLTFNVPLLWAAPDDSGTITVTGSVAPSPSNFIFALTSSVPEGQAQPQGTEITYTITYSSSNPTTVPLHFVAEWDQGTIEGATEPSVNTLEYVIGSATTAYGTTVPIVDTLNRTISWSISDFPANLTGQTVTFKLRTLDTYTGTNQVSVPVRVYSTSPIGVPEATLTTLYRYQAPSPTASPTPTPTPTATATPSTSASTASSTPTPVSSATSVSTGLTQPAATQFKSVRIKALGSSAAKIEVIMNKPVTLILNYGFSPTALNTTLLQPPLENAQEFVITELSPKTKYYFQIFAADASRSATDIFTFETTSVQSDMDLGQVGIMLTQMRTVIYAGQTATQPGDPTQPMTVVKNTVVDVSLNIPKSQNLKTLDVLIRNFDVLGASTETINVDELQSRQTRMTKVADNLFVGRLRTPVTTGKYEVVSQIEDEFGNLSETELGIMNVISPLTVLDAETKEPLEFARTFVYIYNTQTRLFEKLSNVTSLAANPAFSDRRGVVNLGLFPGNYAAEISLIGYKPIRVEFSVGTDHNANFPTVYLEPRGMLLSARSLYILGMANQISEMFDNGIHTLSLSPRMVSFVIGLAVFILMLKLMYFIWHQRHLHQRPEVMLITPYPYLWQKLLIWGVFILWRTVRFIGEVCVLLQLLFGFHLLKMGSLGPASVILGLSVATVLLWGINVWQSYRDLKRAQVSGQLP